jgi:hypothetical protein
VVGNPYYIASPIFAASYQNDLKGKDSMLENYNLACWFVPKQQKITKCGGLHKANTQEFIAGVKARFHQTKEVCNT